jgi:hypothetical protein
VVKFMVKVRLMEKSVNNHVGSVMVVKVMSHKRAPGRKLKTERRAYPKPVEVPACACSLVAFIDEAMAARLEERVRNSPAIDGVAVDPSESMIEFYEDHKGHAFLLLIAERMKAVAC